MFRNLTINQTVINVMKRALIIGANGTIGSALATLASENYQLETLSRETTNYSEDELTALAKDYKERGVFDLIICCIGVLHNENVSPEKRLAHLNEASLAEYFRINVILPSLCLKAFSKLLNKQTDSRFVFLSAMVGSITDNELGGWYGYRSSKAALNMMIKTASVELARVNKCAALAVIHPGTTIGELSKPFASGVAKDKYYTPQQTASRLLNVAESLTKRNSGTFYNWDGSVLPW